MKTTQIKKALILATLVTGVTAAGCELIVDFDRTKIPVENVDSGLIDAAIIGEGGIAPAIDGGADATTDAGDAGETETDAGDGGDAS